MILDGKRSEFGCVREDAGAPAEEKRHTRRRSLAGLATVLVFFGLIAWFAGRPMVAFVSDPERFRYWVASNGIWGRLAFVGMMALQVVVAVIPGEPLEIGAGYAFGAWEGTGLCLLGAVVGSAVVFLLVRLYGVRLVERFFPVEKIRQLRFLKDAHRRDLLMFILCFIPGTPKDLLSYFVGLTDMSLARWLAIVSVARIPSVITSTIGGDALGGQNYRFAVAVFVLTVLISAAGLLVYQKICRAHDGDCGK